MIVEQAHKLLIDKMSNWTAIACFEYNTVFVFNIVPTKDANANTTMFDSLFSVDKQSGEIKNFKPFDISLEEYRAGKEIKNFK